MVIINIQQVQSMVSFRYFISRYPIHTLPMRTNFQTKFKSRANALLLPGTKMKTTTCSLQKTTLLCLPSKSPDHVVNWGLKEFCLEFFWDLVSKSKN